MLDEKIMYKSNEGDSLKIGYFSTGVKNRRTLTNLQIYFFFRVLSTSHDKKGIVWDCEVNFDVFFNQRYVVVLFQ